MLTPGHQYICSNSSWVLHNATCWKIFHFQFVQNITENDTVPLQEFVQSIKKSRRQNLRLQNEKNIIDGKQCRSRRGGSL